MRTGPAMGSFRAGSFPIPDGGAGDGTACGSALTDSTTCRHQGEAAGPLRTGKRGKLLQCYGHLDLGRSGDLAPTFEEIDLSTRGHRDSARRGPGSRTGATAGPDRGDIGPGDATHAHGEALLGAGAAISAVETHCRYFPPGEDQGHEESERARTAMFHDRGLAVLTISIHS